MTTRSLSRFWKPNAFIDPHETLGRSPDDPEQVLPDPPPARARAAREFAFGNPVLLPACIPAFEARARR